MKKLAIISAGAMVAAGLVLVPGAGAGTAATAATAAAAATVGSPVAQVHPRITAAECESEGGWVVADFWSPTGFACADGLFNDEPVSG